MHEGKPGLFGSAAYGPQAEVSPVSMESLPFGTVSNSPVSNKVEYSFLYEGCLAIWILVFPRCFFACLWSRTSRTDEPVRSAASRNQPHKTSIVEEQLFRVQYEAREPFKIPHRLGARAL